MKILVVDDSITIRRIIINALKTIGYTQVAEANNGKDGLAKVANTAVDFVITDWNMPEMNGLEFTKALRAEGPTADLPILMITTRGTENDVIEALQAKVNSYIVKPFTPQELKEKIDEIVRSMEMKAA
ncbi:MAG TPA: two-component system response regulator [Bacteroidetes bacterium]|nr:two-component system response regulator [Bacteroidota bacterium]